MNNLEEIRNAINICYLDKKSWRMVGKEFDLKPSTARLIAIGQDPGTKIRRKLGLPIYASVVVLADEPIPEGTQVITAVRCSCGQWYVSNHPARKRCFICSPWRGRK